VESALCGGVHGAYALQASIAALHANPASSKGTNWPQIAALYDALLAAYPLPVVEVNRAVAVATARSAQDGLIRLDELETREELSEFHLLSAARDDLLRRLGNTAEAEDAYRRALSVATNDVERRFLRRNLAEIK
jgi:RNA polymerase sigma-70 factor (ECF subfamily)